MPSDAPVSILLPSLAGLSAHALPRAGPRPRACPDLDLLQMQILVLLQRHGGVRPTTLPAPVSPEVLHARDHLGLPRPRRDLAEHLGGPAPARDNDTSPIWPGHTHPAGHLYLAGKRPLRQRNRLPGQRELTTLAERHPRTGSRETPTRAGTRTSPTWSRQQLTTWSAKSEHVNSGGGRPRTQPPSWDRQTPHTRRRRRAYLARATHLPTG